MADLSTLKGDFYFPGTLTVATGLNFPDGSVDDAAVDASAGIAASKLEHQYCFCLAQPTSDDWVGSGRVVHVVYGATATALGFRLTCSSPPTSTRTVTADLKVNGVSALTGVVTFTSSFAAYHVVEGTFSDGSWVQGDVISINMAVSGSGTLPQGAFAELVMTEDAN